MTGPEHYREAERLIQLSLAQAERGDIDTLAAFTMQQAQVNATLAAAAATVEQTAARVPGDITAAWKAVVF